MGHRIRFAKADLVRHVREDGGLEYVVIALLTPSIRWGFINGECAQEEGRREVFIPAHATVGMVNVLDTINGGVDRIEVGVLMYGSIPMIYEIYEE